MNIARTVELAQSFNTFVRRIGVAFSVLALAGALIFASPASNESRADTIPVPNGDFETLYKPGSTEYTVTTLSDWVDGVGPDAPVRGAGATYSDGSEGTTVDVPGWLGSPGWPGENPPDVPINQQGAIQSGAQDTGLYCLNANGGNWGAGDGEMVVSAAPLAEIMDGLIYTLSVRIQAQDPANPPLPLVWELLANGSALTPSSSVEPALTNSYQDYSKTYDAADLLSHLGESLTIRLGTGFPSPSGTQTRFDNVSLTFIPEPSTFLLAALGLLSLAWYGWRRRR